MTAAVLAMAAGGAVAKTHHHHQPAQDAWLPVPLKAALDGARGLAARRDRDQFAGEDGLVALAGSEFTISLAPEANYRDGQLRLSVRTTSVQVHKGDLPSASPSSDEFDTQLRRYLDSYPAVGLRSSSRSTGSYLAGNAFGALADVEASSARHDDLIFANLHGQGLAESPTFELDVNAAPDIARALASSVKFVVTGHIVALPDGGVSGCIDNYYGATIDAPYSISDRECWVSAVVTNASFVDQATGNALKTVVPTDSG